MQNPLFRPILLNVLFSSVTNMFVWFALTFWVFLSTRSILATSVLAGLFAVFNAITAIYFGALVDHHRKHLILVFSSAASFLCFLAGGALYFSGGYHADIGSLKLWAMICVLMLGTVIGNIRAVALSVVVKILFSDEERPKANGLVGMVNGISFATTSVLSGFAIGTIGMGPALILVLISTIFIMLHALTTKIPENHLEGADLPKKEVDIRGTIAMIRETPGFFFLIFFTTFNNFLGGVFMALMDAYGLSLVDVKVWGVLLGILSFSFIGGGLVVARYGLGKDPVTKLFLLNMVTWTTCIFFTIQPSVVLLVMGMFVWMFLTPMIEASEQTVIQKVVPLERQGRVVGFAQSIESAASPVTAFIVGPITQIFIVPFMTVGAGVTLIGGWFGTGPDRAIALVFTLVGVIGLTVALAAVRSSSTKALRNRYMAPEPSA